MVVVPPQDGEVRRCRLGSGRLGGDRRGRMVDLGGDRLGIDGHRLWRRRFGGDGLGLDERRRPRGDRLDRLGGELGWRCRGDRFGDRLRHGLGGRPWLGLLHRLRLGPGGLGRKRAVGLGDGEVARRPRVDAQPAPDVVAAELGDRAGLRHRLMARGERGLEALEEVVGAGDRGAAPASAGARRSSSSCRCTGGSRCRS